MPSCLPINLDDLLHFRGVESARVEFKASWNDGPTLDQMLETICAFANDFYNVNGGYLILGVAEENGRAVIPPKGLEPAAIDTIQKSIRGNCRRIEPEYQPVLSPEIVGGQNILVVWAPASDNRPHQAPSSRDPSKREYFVRLGSQTVKAERQILTDLLQMTAKVPFDDRRATAYALSDLRSTLVREFLRDVRSSLIEELDDVEIYRRMRLSFRVNGHEVPRNVALLFFSDDPEQKGFPGARIEVVHFADDAGGNVLEERVFRGPLHQQIRDCLTYLGNMSASYVEKQPRRAEASGWVSFPYQALEEAIVNAVYHRSYEGTPEPTKVYLYPDRLEITSYPGPVAGLSLEHFQPGKRIPPVPARNRRIGELLKELRLAEARGTGVPTVFRAMAENGSPEPRFEFDEDKTYFTVTLPAHPEYVALTALREAALAVAKGDRRGAIRRLEAAHSSLPGSGVIAAALIDEIFSEDLPDIHKAEEVYRRFRAQPDRRDERRVILVLAEGYFDTLRDEDAQRVLSDMPATTAEQDVLELAIWERRAGREDQAHALFVQAGDRISSDARGVHEFAQTKLQLAKRLARPRKRLDRETRTRLLTEAEELLRRVVQMNVAPARRAWAWFNLGEALEGLGAPKGEVMRAYEEAQKLLPSEPRFFRKLPPRPGS
jgi:ATP-dependent DNA helicase RecG